MNRLLVRRFASTAAAAALFAVGTPGAARTTDSLDLEAAAGFSSNPTLQFDARSSAFGRISGLGVHSWITERGSTTLTAYLENTTYLKDYGSKQLVDLSAQTTRSISPTVSVFGALGFQMDFAGQLSNRLIHVPVTPIVPTPPEVTVPVNPLPPVETNPDLLGFAGREYRFNGSVGASIRMSRGVLTLSAGAQRATFSKDSSSDFNSYFVNGGYSQQISPRTSLGGMLSLQRQDFHGGDWANIINPTVTAHTNLTETLVGEAAVGLMVIDQSTAGDHTVRYTPSFSGSLCSSGERSQWCARVSRDAQTAVGSRIANGSGSPTISTSASIDYSRRLAERQMLQASLSLVNYTNASNSNNLNNFRVRTTYLSAVVGYDRGIGHRLYAGIQGGARKLFQVGPDPDLDFNANVYLRYRLGDLQ